MRDLSHLIPPPTPGDDRIEAAAEILRKLSEVEAIHGNVATFRRKNLECTGVWPADTDYGHLADVDVPVPEYYPDVVDLEGNWRRQLARCRRQLPSRSTTSG